MPADSLTVPLRDVRTLVEDVEPEVGDVLYHRVVATLDRFAHELSDTRVLARCKRYSS